MKMNGLILAAVLCCWMTASAVPEFLMSKTVRPPKVDGVISSDEYANAVTLCGLMILLAFFGGTVICATSPASFSDGLFESISALATVGLSTGITPLLSVPAQLLIILYMYFGRVGILTLSLGFLQEKASQNKIKYAETNLLIG